MTYFNTDADLAFDIVCRMIVEDFASMSENDRIAMTIVTIHRDSCFMCVLPESWKTSVVNNYYESRWKGADRTDETRSWCKHADALMPKWHALYEKHKAAFLAQQK